MTKQDKINFNNSHIQYLFLVTQNVHFQHDAGEIYDKHKVELDQLVQNSQLTALILDEAGSESLKNHIISSIKKSPLFYTPDRLLLRATIVYYACKYELPHMFKSIEKYVKLLRHPVAFNSNATEYGSEIYLSFSNYHNKTDVIRSIKMNWKEIEDKRKVFIDRFDLKLTKNKKRGNFAKDLKIYFKYIKGNKSYRKPFSEASTTPTAMNRIKKKIASLYYP